MIHPILRYRLIRVMAFTVTISLQINHISLACGPSLGVAALPYLAYMNDLGLIRQPKYSHLKDLHKVIKRCEHALVSSDPTVTSLGTYQQAHVFFAGTAGCAAFLANYHVQSAATVVFNNKHYDLPPWSISILPDCKTSVFNTAKVRISCRTYYGLSFSSIKSLTSQQLVRIHQLFRQAKFDDPSGHGLNIFRFSNRIPLLFEQGADVVTRTALKRIKSRSSPRSRRVNFRFSSLLTISFQFHSAQWVVLQYNFEGRYDLVRFIKTVQKVGLYVNLRIGPYVCAEWNFGGIPVWLKYVPGISFRTDNEPFKVELSLISFHDLVWFIRIENEYGPESKAMGAAGHAYLNWAAYMAVGLGTGVPWVMCKEIDAPDPVINSCNGFYCDDSLQINHISLACGPSLGVAALPYLAYMNDLGLIRQPKYSHLKDLHKVIKRCEHALVSSDPTVTSLGTYQQAHVFSAGTAGCAAFLANYHVQSAATVVFNNKHYDLPPWSISILLDCKTSVFNTAKVRISCRTYYGLSFSSIKSLTSQQLVRIHQLFRQAKFDDPSGHGLNIFRFSNRIPLLFEQGADVVTRTALKRIK
ncbi:hypothetical protein RYX36_020791 [Vicia faba]